MDELKFKLLIFDRYLMTELSKAGYLIPNPESAFREVIGADGRVEGYLDWIPYTFDGTIRGNGSPPNLVLRDILVSDPQGNLSTLVRGIFKRFSFLVASQPCEQGIIEKYGTKVHYKVLDNLEALTEVSRRSRK